MARKDLLKGLLDPPAVATDTPPAPNPRYARGAIGAVNRSIADLKARAVIDLDPHLIDAGGMQDRLESDSVQDAGLAASIAEYGQQVPVLVRPHPTEDGRYQIVYGRRRVLALRDLGQPVKALVRDLDDQELVLAQGQENTARRDLSFIEKVNFARQMVAAGYKRKVICDALTVDKTLISRMISIAERIPTEVIEAIGAAPNIGRDRWSALADRLESSDFDGGAASGLIELTAGGKSSDQRFEALFAILVNRAKAAQQDSASEPLTEPLTDHQGMGIGTVQRRKSGVTLSLSGPGAHGFDDWLLALIPDLYRQWHDSRGDQDQPQP